MTAASDPWNGVGDRKYGANTGEFDDVDAIGLRVELLEINAKAESGLSLNYFFRGPRGMSSCIKPN
jgi:hypothetical protein